MAKKKKFFSVLTATLIFVFAFSLLTACNDETTLESLKNDYGASIDGGSFPEGATLVTTLVDETSDQGKEALTAIKGYDYNTFKTVYIYDISVLKDNAKLQPNGKVKVTIPVTAELVTYRIVFHIKDNDTVEKLSATYADGKMSFETDSFSIFVLAEPTMINHLHTFSDEWDHDEQNHWHNATCEHYAEKSDLGEHTWDSGEITTPATEDADGIKTYTCTVCDYQKTEPTKYHEHDFSGEWSQSETHHWHDCMSEDCDAVSNYEEHYYDPHTWWDIVKPATEDEEGEMIRICIGCKYEDRHVIPKYDPAHEHTYSEEWASNVGYHWHYATCAHLNEYGDEAEHTWDKGVVTKPATDENGIITYTCTVCGRTKQEPILHEHTFSEEWSKNETHHWHAATCSHTTEIDGRTEHTWDSGEITTPATEDADGIKTYTCTVCGETKEEHFEYVAHVHTFSTLWKKNDEYHWHACTGGDDCTETADKAEHTWGEPNVKREPTHLSGGLTEYTCTVCDWIKKVTTPHEHTYGDWQFSPTYHWQIANCGYWSGHDGIRGSESSHEYADGFCKCGIKDPSVASEGLEFTLQDDGTYYVSGIGTCTDVHIVIPSEYEGKAVTGIADGAFSSKSTLRSVYLPDSVKTVGDNAFKNCYGLNSVRFPDEMTDIGEYAFCNCSLYTLTLPTKGLSELKGYAFSENSELLDLYIPDNIKTIGTGAFSGCRAVTELRLPETMEALGERCFQYLRSLTQVTVPKGLTELPGYVFANCTALTQVEIPGWIKTIGERAFTGCTSLTAVELADGLTCIGAYAFNATKLNSVTIPASLTELTEEGSFYGCAELVEVILHEGVITIGKATFRNCTKLSKITLPAGLTKLAEQAFENTAIVSIVIPEKITVIEQNVFNYCKKLTSVTLPEGLLKIDYYAFYCCSALGEISIPESVTEIEGYAFYYCTALTTVNIPNSLTKISTSVFSGTKLKTVVIPDSVTSIGSYAFSQNSELESVTFGKNIKTIDSSAFEQCKGLASIALPSSLESIGSDAFWECDSLTAVTIPASVTIIEDRAFAYCDALTTVTVPSGIKKIGKYVFYNSANVKFSEYDNAYYIGNETEPYMILVRVKDTSVTTCTIHPDARLIAGAAFNGAAMTEVTIPDNIQFIGTSAFSLLEKLNISSADDWCTVYVGAEKTYVNMSEHYYSSWSTESKYATSETRANVIVYSVPSDMFRGEYLSGYTYIKK